MTWYDLICYGLIELIYVYTDVYEPKCTYSIRNGSRLFFFSWASSETCVYILKPGSVVACLVFRRRVARCSVAAGDLPKTVQEMKTELLGIRWDQLSTTRWCPQSLVQLVKKWLEVGERMGLC